MKVTVKRSPILWRPRKPSGFRGLVGGFHLFTIEISGPVYLLLAAGQPTAVATDTDVNKIYLAAEKTLGDLQKAINGKVVCETCSKPKRKR